MKTRTKLDLQAFFGTATFILLFLAWIGLPFIFLYIAGLWWAVFIGIVCPMIWVKVMPCTCMSGGLIASIFGIYQLNAGLFWAGIGMLNLIR